MRSPGSRSHFTAWKAIALLTAIAGLVSLVSVSVLAGVGLIVAAGVVYRHARETRAAYLQRQQTTGLWQWAQGLGPRGNPQVGNPRVGRRRP